MGGAAEIRPQAKRKLVTCPALTATAAAAELLTEATKKRGWPVAAHVCCQLPLIDSFMDVNVWRWVRCRVVGWGSSGGGGGGRGSTARE